MKKRGLASIFIVSIITIAAVFGVVFAFQNAGRAKDVYGSITVTVDKPNVQLEIELEKDPTTDNQFNIKDTLEASTYVTVTVAGVPNSVDRRAKINKASISNGVVSVKPITPDAEAGETGINVFEIKGLNAGNTVVEFTAFGGQVATVSVKVNLTAKDMQLTATSHFGIRQGGAALNLKSSDVLSKFVFYAHPEADEHTYKPNVFPVEYRLQHHYDGIILDDQGLRATNDTIYVNRYIYVQFKLSTMENWLDVPFYVFPSVNKIYVETDAYKASTTANNPKIWDLIINRTEKTSANFVFSLDCSKTQTSDYGFEVRSADTKMVRVDPGTDRYQRSLSAVENLGEVAIYITSYPIVKDNGREIYYNDTADANVQITDTIYIRVRNEFYLESEGTESFNLATNKKTLDAFYYEGNNNQDDYYDTFTLDTENGKTVNVDAEIEFELEVDDKVGNLSGIYDRNSAIDIFSILQISYWSSAVNDWVMLTQDNYAVNYANRFAVAFARSSILASSFISDQMTLTLRIKSVNKLSVGGYASCEIKLDVTSAIDRFDVKGLTQFDDGSMGVALVYDTLHQEMVGASVDVYGQYAETYGNETVYKNSQKWNTAKVLDNSAELPFKIKNQVVENEPGVKGFYHLRYDIAIKDIKLIEYYKDYPMTIEYTNGKTCIFYIRVYPTVDNLSMSVVSSSKGKIYKTITHNNGTTNYNYVRTVYVRKGYSYEFAIDTPSVNVGAYAVFDKIYNAKGESITQTTVSSFDARNLDEGLYECRVSLHAYSDEVFGQSNPKNDILVYIIVVDPIGNVTIPTNISLDGIGDSFDIELLLKTLNNQYINDFSYLHIDLDQTNENVVIERNSEKPNQFKITAKYLTDEPFDIGFRIYKSYNFSEEFDLDGKWTANKPFEFYYIGNALVTTKVTIRDTKTTSIKLDGYTDNDNGIGKYIRLISNPVSPVSIGYHSNLANQNAQSYYGITYVKWENGKFNFSAFESLDSNQELKIDDFAEAKFNAVTGKIDVTPLAGETSLGTYALVIYTRDSLRYAGMNGENELVLPDVYEILPLYIGTEAEIDKIENEIISGNVHDANSGKRNDRGGFNWVVANQEDPTNQYALLFYTPEPSSNHHYSSPIKANLYYLDDLYTVLGASWSPLKNASSITVTKYVKDQLIGSKTFSNKKRLFIDLDYKFDRYDDSVPYSTNDAVVKYEVNALGSKMTFFVVEYLDTFEVNVETRSGNSGMVSRKNLAPNEYANAVDTITLQRGNEFWFNTNLNLYSGWQYRSPDFDSDEQQNTANISYAGGTYSFNPYIQFENNGNVYTFDLDVLTATINVKVKGGVNYLNITQDTVTLDGVTMATYDLAVRVDQESWSLDLLKYNFLYDGIYYTLFENGNNVSYVVLEGGKSKLEFKVTCENAESPVYANFYYTYYLKIEVSMVIISPDVDPFYDISGARLIVQENLDNSPLAQVKTSVSDSAAFNLTKQGIYNVTMTHFAETNVVESNKSALTLASGQTNAGVIYLDQSSAGGILTVYPTPHYINVYNINLWTSQPHSEKVLIGTDLSGKPIYDTVTYSIAFTQMIYNEQEKYYQPYISGGSTPKMVSSWSPAEGYKWTGKYYFKTYIVSSSQVSHRLTDGTRFAISISIQGESNAKAITETIILNAKYRNSFVVDPGDDTEDYMVCTMSQTRYQALGTTAVYDVALPNDCVPNYANFTFNEVNASTNTIDLSYATVTIDSVVQTLTVYLKADVASIGKNLEVRIPYTRPGDYVNPYLSVVIVPVYFEFDNIEVVDHYESILQVSTDDELKQLNYRGLFKYDTSMASSSLNDKMKAFNTALKSADKTLLMIDYETAGQITVQIAYSYLDGVPVLTKNGSCRYERTFNYHVIETPDALIKRTEYLAVGTSATYTFYDWNALYTSQLYLEGGKSNNLTIADYWRANLSAQGNTIKLNVSLENRSTKVTNNAAYQALIKAGKIVINVFSNTDRINPQLELTIIPVYFTFDEFKLHNNPVNPLVALTTPTQITVEAGGIAAVDDVDVTNAINTFNQSLLSEQDKLSNSTALSFSRVPNDSNVLNFDFDTKTRALTRADASNPITTTSYLLITAGITYVNGIPFLDAKGDQISTYIPVRTFGTNTGDGDGTLPDLDTAPERNRTVAQAIGTTVRYNIALAGVTYDSWLDKYEIRADGNHVWDRNSGWNVIINVKDKILAVTLDPNTDLFDKVLVIKAYNHEGELTYVLKIVPAYFTVEQILLEDHIDEVPVMIKNGDPTWLTQLRLNFVTNHCDQSLVDFDFENGINEFYQSLNSSSLLSRIDDAGYITLIAGVNYGSGIPSLTNLVNSLTTVQNTYRYIMVDGTPENTKAQALGQEVYYNVNRTVGSIKISGGIADDGTEIWENNYSGFSPYWWVENDYTNPRRIKVGLSDQFPDYVIGNRIRIGIFVNPSDVEPSYILNIIPAYFTVENLTVEGQSVDNREIYLYYGENPGSPDEVIFDAVFGKYSLDASLNVPQRIAAFVNELQSSKANLIGRYYDTNLSSGDLHITLYLDYTNGSPTLVSSASVDHEFVVRLDSDFTYAIYGRPDIEEQLPSMPTEPRTRTEVQAIGTTAHYTIDLDKNISMDVDDLTYDDTKGWKVTFADNIVTVELSADANKTASLLKNDIELNFYSGYDLVFVLTIQPVLFEIVGVGTVYPEQPIDLSNGKNLDSIEYYVEAKYNDKVKYNGNSVIKFIESFNSTLNQEKGGLLSVVIEEQYLKIDVAVDYGSAGSDYRTVPALLNVENYPLKVIESYLEFTEETKRSTSATHNQAIGTTVYYHLGAEFIDANTTTILIDGNPLDVGDDNVTAKVVAYGSSYALQVSLKGDENLVRKMVTIEINYGTSQTFTMKIKPVWFLVEGFDVIRHPERHLWLISSEQKAEKVNDLMFRVRASYATSNISSSLKQAIQNRIDTFNYQLAEYSEENSEWIKKLWADYLETYTVGGEYLVVRAAVKYDEEGVASIIDMNQAKPTQVVRDIFKYVRYSDQISGSGVAYPNVPRSRTVEITIGYDAEYTLDLPNLKAGFTNDMIALYENYDKESSGDDSKLQSYTNGSGAWSVQANHKKLSIHLDPDTSLVNRELKVFIYKDRNSVKDQPDSYDTENVAFILTIHPVWFKVTDLTLTGYPDDTIYVDNINDFMTEITKVDSGKKFVPVFEYSQAVLKSENGSTLQSLMKDFTNKFISSNYVSKTRTRVDNETYYFQVTTSVDYVPFEGIPLLTDEMTNRIWQSFEIKVLNDGTLNDVTYEERTEYQAIGTTETYYVDSSVLADVESIENDENGQYTIVDWQKEEKNYVTVALANTVTVDTPIRVKISDHFTLIINPVYYKVLGFETVDHPERSVWILSPNTVKDLRYRVITTEISANLDAETLATVQASLDNLNASLNNGNAPIAINYDSNENIVFDAAVNYENGYPVIVEITKDKRNVVESIIPYRIWSSTQKPKPEQPTVVGATQVNQVIGSTKLYTLKNIKGQVFYQYLWTENAGSLVTPFEKSENGTLQVYEGLSILVDSNKETLQIQLVADAAYLTKTIKIYLPYLTSVNGKEIWYSHCIEITPVLFELKGWTIEGVGTTSLYKDSNHDDYLLLTKDSDPVTRIRYVAQINACVTENADLIRKINIAKANLENMALNYVHTTVLSDNIGFDGLTLRLNIPADRITDNYVGFSSYIIYEDGVPQLVTSSKTLISNQILISTGYEISDWEDKVGDEQLSSGVNYAVHAIGTTKTYMVEIPGAGKIFENQITVVNQDTQLPIKISGEQVNLVTVEHEIAADNMLTLTVNLAPVIALRDINVEIKIPYAEDPLAEKPNYVYSYYITPVIYIVEGFYLTKTEDNYLELSDREVALELHAKTVHSDDVSVRNIVNLLMESFESSVNNAIRNGTLEFVVINGTGGVNVSLNSYGNTVWIQKMGDKTALNYINGSIHVGYTSGMPQLGGVNPLTDEVIDIQIQVHTQQGATNYFPGWDNLTLGHTTQFLQSIGTSRDYPIVVNDMNVVFYYEYIEVFNGGLKRGEHEYEFFVYDIINSGRQNLTLGFTLRASAKNLNDWIDIRIPYTNLVEGKVVWSYYSLQIKPILFEIKGWKLKVGDELVDSITLDDSAVELYFSPEIVSGPLNQNYYSVEELLYIKSAIKRLETEINTYDPKISDGYTYMVINNTAQEGYQVNYSIFHDDSSNISYMLRDTAESSTTIMQISANITYGVTDFSKEYVDGAQAITAYSNTENAQRITGRISIYTTEKAASGSTGDRSTVFITQENASRLLSLNSGIDYVLMSDIYLYRISGLNNGLWKPVDFPVNATLDGNNFKIYFTNLGFDLSGNPSNIGLFSGIPTGSVVKNLQIVVDQGTTIAPITEIKVDLTKYSSGTVNIGLLAGVNNGIITNCAVLSGWQFNMQNLTDVDNPVTGTKFDKPLPFNKDGYVFDDNYFYEIGLNRNNEPTVTQVYNQLGYGVTKNEVTGKWDKVVYDIYMNVANWINPDRTNVARYDGYSPILFNESSTIDSKSSGKILVYTDKNNSQLNVTLGGLVGSNTYMITNSRVLIDVELWGPAHLTDAGSSDEVNVLSSVVGGVVGINAGTITSSYFRDGSVINNANANTLEGYSSLLGGFVGQNSGTIQQSYAMGRSTERETNLNYISTAGAVKTIRNSLGGFAHINSGTITNCLVNMVILKTGTEGAAGGFVYQNMSKGVISNCIENNDIILQSSSTLDYYAPFVVINGDKPTAGKVVTNNLSNLIYAGNAEGISFSDDWKGTLKHLTNNSANKYGDINNYEGFSIGQAQDDQGAWGVTPKNTIWIMTDVGPMLRAANEITVSYRKYTWSSSPYLYAPGTAENPYLIWNEDQFNDYVYAATAHATESDKDAETKPLTNIENSRQNNHLRLVDNVTMTGIKDTYKVIYTGTFEGNGLTMSGISLDTVTNDLATMGLFGKTEYATIRNINFEIGNINSTARYVGGIAGIAINTNFVDVKVLGNKDVIKGANIVGGFVGLNVVNDTTVENYNLYSSVSVTANFHNQQTDVGAEPFSSGKEYYQQTLYSKVEALDISYEQGFGTAGAVFGFVTGNPNNYRVVDNSGNVTIYARQFTKNIIKQDASGNIIDQTTRSSKNSEASWFLKDKAGNVINDTVTNGKGLYYMDPIILRNVSGNVQNVSANVAGGLIGIMDETIELRKPDLMSLTSLTGKYYLGGLVGINLGKISGGITQNSDGSTIIYSTMNLSKWSVSSSAGSSYVFRDNPATSSTTRFWGMTVGAVAGYSDGYYGNLDSGVIENINVDVNLLSATSSTLQYVIGGVVGSVGDYATIDNAKNLNTNINFNGIRVTLNHVQKFGFYFGRVVGRGSASTLSANGNSTTARMTTIQVNVPYYSNQSYISLKDFATSDYYDGINNAFGVTGDTTLKVQTMTLEEYREYLKSVITGPGAGIGGGSGTGPDSGHGSGSGSGSDEGESKYPGLDPAPGGDWEYDENNPGGSGSGNDNIDWGNNEGFPSLDFANKDLVTRVVLLEPLLKQLPRTLGTAVINGKTVRVEKYESASLSSLMSYIIDNHIFDVWDSAHTAIENFSQKVKDNYESYVQYSAVSTKPANEESESEFVNNLETYRQERYNRAYTLFTYQYRISKNSKTINGPQNADFTWRQYEEYTIMKASAKGSYVDHKSTVYRNFVTIYGEKLANIVYPEKATVQYIGGQAQTENNHAIFLNMVAEVMNPDFNAFYTNQDPLQIYINYVTETAKENNAFMANGGWKMSIFSYYYYMKNIYGQTYTYEKAKYTVPKDFPETTDKGYVGYLYLNALLQDSGSVTMTIPEFIDMIKHEEAIVVKNEENWVLTGHLTGSVNNKSRISDIGGVTLGWVSNIENWDDTAKSKVSTLNGVISYDTGFEQEAEKHQWPALAKYLEAKTTKFLTIAQYREMINLGGTLYELANSTYETAAAYITALKSEQYNWSQQQLKFINTYYVKDGVLDLNYALAATTDGNILDAASKGNLRAIYKTKSQIYDEVSNIWFNDNNGDGKLNADSNEPSGTMRLVGSSFNNGNGVDKTDSEITYYFYGGMGTIYLDEHQEYGLGAAMYVDINGDKLFNPDKGDILVIYKVDASLVAPDFYVIKKDDTGEEIGRDYYRIARQILPGSRVITSGSNELSGNSSDYLEEALWWRNQGFTAGEFDQIKNHAMVRSVPTAAQVNISVDNHGVISLTRQNGYTVADDWTAEKGGFKRDGFGTENYVDIVTNSKYDGDVWYSNYADYKLFNKLYYGQKIESGEIDKLIPSTSKFNNPFPVDRYGFNESGKFVQALAPETDLANAIEFTASGTANVTGESDASETADNVTVTAYLALLRAGSTTATYITWAKNFYYLVKNETNGGENKPVPEYFRLNHYIYYVQEKLGDNADFEPEDFRWVLRHDIRLDIFYNGVTEAKRTTDLVAYRRDWYNKGGDPYITFRDYCEWINIYAYSDEYRTARGDFEDTETGETLTSTDGWLTIEAFAVWKRMEKYENNVEYLAKIGEAAGQDPISAPIYKRKISTTVFPRIFSSGEQTVDENGMITNKNYVFPEKGYKKDDAIKSDFLIKVLGWGERKGDDYVYSKDYEKYPMDPQHQRNVKDRFEYNERYTIFEVDTWFKYEDDIYQSALKQATQIIQDKKFAKACDEDCGGKDNPKNCTDHTHAAYHIRRWYNNGYGFRYFDNTKEFQIDHGDSLNYHLDGDNIKASNQYLQLYVPYTNFEKACKIIKSLYSKSNDYKGYFNYMKYWAKNGGPSWICVYPSNNEYDGPTTGLTKVTKTFMVTNFWDNFDFDKDMELVIK